MDKIFKHSLKSISLGLSILLFIGLGCLDSQGGEASLAQATFYVY